MPDDVFSIHPEELIEIIDKHDAGETLTKEEIDKLINAMQMFHRKACHWELEASK